MTNYLKQYLINEDCLFTIVSIIGDLESVLRKIVLQVEAQARKIRAAISSQCIRIQHVHRIPLFEPLLHHLEELVNTPPIVLENPVTRKPQGRPISAKNKNKRTMQRD
ncbi:14898_t:CDS:2 [Gigaspora rosea]|nr:14898_t:CDS:2 [Gigaspora rosea]